ncbi:MAG: MATE family efflux transporter [Succinivibrionaceae bacterium]|nr:MATE family efflux transporter [Succinivibrionaceae bacterium]
MFKLIRTAGELDILHGSIWDKLVAFAVPLAITGMFQQLFNAADVMVLGRHLGTGAMAAVGSVGPVVGLLVSLMMGLSLGANVAIARHIGAREGERLAAAVGNAMLIALVGGTLMLVAAEALLDRILVWLVVPQEIAAGARTYLASFLVSVPFMAAFNFEAAILRSKGDTVSPLISLGISSAANIALNLVFIRTFEDGILGVAVATDIANALSAAILLVSLRRRGSSLRLTLSGMRPSRLECGFMLRIGVPAAIQGMVFSVSNLIIQAAINSLGAKVVAASVAAFTIEINVYCVTFAFAQGITTFVSQCYGACDIRRCLEVTRVGTALTCAVVLGISLAVLAAADPLLSIFSDDPEVVETGRLRILFVVLPGCVNTLIDIFSGTLRGYGISMPPALAALVCICGVRVLWVYTAFAASPSFGTLMVAYPLSWALTVALILLIYRFYRRNFLLQ